MFKSTTAKKLYRFSKKQNNKQSASTKDLNDSLDIIATDPPPSKHHQRTQSCPEVPPTEVPNNETNQQQKTTRSYKLKPTHRNCRSQA